MDEIVYRVDVDMHFCSNQCPNKGKRRLLATVKINSIRHYEYEKLLFISLYKSIQMLMTINTVSDRLCQCKVAVAPNLTQFVFCSTLYWPCLPDVNKNTF